MILTPCVKRVLKLGPSRAHTASRDRPYLGRQLFPLPASAPHAAPGPQPGVKTTEPPASLDPSQTRKPHQGLSRSKPASEHQWKSRFTWGPILRFRWVFPFYATLLHYHTVCLIYMTAVVISLIELTSYTFNSGCCCASFKLCSSQMMVLISPLHKHQVWLLILASKQRIKLPKMQKLLKTSKFGHVFKFFTQSSLRLQENIVLWWENYNFNAAFLRLKGVFFLSLPALGYNSSYCLQNERVCESLTSALDWFPQSFSRQSLIIKKTAHN